MDIPRRKNRDRPDKLTAELLFFCFWLTHCGEVELGDFKWHCGERSSASYRRYAEELAACGAIPRLKLRDNGRRFVSAPPVEEFVPSVRFDLADDHLRRLARLACMAASVLAPDGELSAFDNAIEDYRYYDLHYPDYHAAYEGLDPRTLRRDKQAVRQVLLRWKDYDARRMQRDEDVEEEITAEFLARLKML
jgi:hypothetical protein